MKQRSLNSHFKVKKNKKDDSTDPKSLEKQEKNMTEKFSTYSNTYAHTDTKRVLFHPESTRAKRVLSGDQDSLEIEEEAKVVGKRVKLEKKKKNSHTNKQVENVSEIMKNSFIHSSKNNVDDHDTNFNNSSKNNLTRNIQSSTSKSTKTSDTNNSTSVSPEISNFTKNIIEQIYKKKQEREETLKLTKLSTPISNFNYLNYSNNFKPEETAKKSNDYLIESNTNQLTPKGVLKDDQKTMNLAPESSNIIKTPIKKIEPPKLSLKTIEEINKIKTERLNRFKRENLSKERKRSQSSFSLRFKYEELLKEDRELMIPTHYKSLYNSFVELDKTLSFFKLSSRKFRLPFFEDVQQSIESTHKHKFEFKTLAQILYVAPHFFIYKWEKKNSPDLNESEFSLIIDIPKDFKARMHENYSEEFNFVKLQTELYDPIVDSPLNIDLEERRKIFKKLLLAIVNEHHNSFLESINYPGKFDPYKFKIWHHEFELENVPQIPIFEILEKPSIKITSIQEFLRDSDITNSLVKRAVDQFNKNENNLSYQNNLINRNDVTNITANTNESDKLSNFLSTSFINKMKAKEEATAISQSIIEYSNTQHKINTRVRDFKEFADKLKTIFMIQRSVSVPLSELVMKLHNTSDSFKLTFSLDNVKNIILKLRDHFPEWLTIFDHSSLGTIVKMDNKYNMINVMQRLSDIAFIEQLNSDYNMITKRNISESIFKMNKVLLTDGVNNSLTIDLLLVRINLVFTHCWFLRSQIKTTDYLKFYHKLYYLVFLKRQINKINKDEYMYLFTEEKNRNILDELNRNYRVITFGLDDYFLKGNFMSRSLNEIIAEDILCDKYNNIELIDCISDMINSNHKLNPEEYFKKIEKIENFEHLLLFLH